MKIFFTLFQILVIFFVTFTSNAQTDCNPATITSVEHEGSGNRITWTMPAGSEEVMISHGGELSGFGIGSWQRSFGVYHRFTSEDLASINGGTLAQVVFAPTYNYLFQTKLSHTYTIQIYQGGIWGEANEHSPGTLISYQELNNEDLLPNQINTITLETPTTIDASQELWIGYFCTNVDSIDYPAKIPAGADAGPCKNGFGNIIFIENQWATLFELASSYDYNWCIKGIVQTIEGESVNIYFNGDKIESNIEGSTYFHENPTGEEHCYKIEINCSEGVVSPFSNEFCIEGEEINENGEVVKFTLYPNPASEIVTIQSYTIINSIQIINIMGQEVFSSHANGEKLNINITNFNAGLYFVRVHTDYGVQNAKFIIE